MFIDSHAHLDSKRFDADRAEVLQRARAKPASRPCSRSATATVRARARSIAPSSWPAEYDWIYATVGIHPHEAALATD